MDQRSDARLNKAVPATARRARSNALQLKGATKLVGSTRESVNSGLRNWQLVFKLQKAQSSSPIDPL